MNAGHVHFYVNIKQWRKVKKKKVEGYSMKYIYFISSGCVEIRLVQRLLGYYFFKSFSQSKYSWVVCMSPGAHVHMLTWVDGYAWRSLEWHEWSAPNHCVMVNRYWRVNCFFLLLTILSCEKWWQFDSSFICSVSSFSYDCAFLFECSIWLWSVVYWSHILLPEWVLIFRITKCKFCISCARDMNPNDWKRWVNGPFCYWMVSETSFVSF
jgi:putative component of membrane protein insertase Oxa1/YidC/SpoIIIJ protein YidD